MDIIPSRLELLKIARELVINEYIDKRAQDHNKWVAEADVAWRTRGVKLAYPSFPIYPSEVDIITRAGALNDFLTKTEPKPDIKPETKIEETVTVPDIIPPVAPPVTDLPVVDAEVKETVVKPPAENFNKMIPPIMAKIEEFKSQWIKK